VYDGWRRLPIFLQDRKEATRSGGSRQALDACLGVLWEALGTFWDWKKLI